jgi:hypothetical protein
MAAVFRSVFARPIQEKLRQPGRLPLLYMGLFNHTGLFRNLYVKCSDVITLKHIRYMAYLQGVIFFPKEDKI